jgi:large subunit ribosomal protein L4
VFGQPVRPDIVARVIRWQLAKRREGNHATKGISQISGTTRKPYKQKGTGRARQGSLRSAQFRGGACIFGPVVRSHAYDMPKKVRKIALRSAFSDKAKSNRLFVCDFTDLKAGKTKELIAAFEAMKINLNSTLIIDGETVNEVLANAVSNLKISGLFASDRV